MKIVLTPNETELFDYLTEEVGITDVAAIVQLLLESEEQPEIEEEAEEGEFTEEENFIDEEFLNEEVGEAEETPQEDEINNKQE